MSEHHDQAHGHGHHHDRGWRAVVRYLRLSPRMWRSPVNREVIEQLDICADERVLDVGAGMGAGVVLAAQMGARVVAVGVMGSAFSANDMHSAAWTSPDGLMWTQAAEIMSFKRAAALDVAAGPGGFTAVGASCVRCEVPEGLPIPAGSLSGRLWRSG